MPCALTVTTLAAVARVALAEATVGRHLCASQVNYTSKLKHPNIVSYKDSFETDNGFLYIAMGFCEGDLYNRLKEQKGLALEERQVVEWFVQIAMALQVGKQFLPSGCSTIPVNGLISGFSYASLAASLALAAAIFSAAALFGASIASYLAAAATSFYLSYCSLWDSSSPLAFF